MDITDASNELTSENRSQSASSIIEGVSSEVEAMKDDLAPGDIVDLSNLLVTAQIENMKDIENAKTKQDKHKITEVKMFETPDFIFNLKRCYLQDAF